MKSYNEVREIVKNTVSEKRFYHSECVAARCVEMATIYGVDKESARLIGIAHDIAKEMPNDEKIKYCKENNIEIDDIESVNLGLLHGKIGADIAKKQFGYSEELCSAIKYHTTGKVNMSMLDKILYVADMTSKDREFKDKERLVKLADTDLDACVKYVLILGIQERILKGKKIHLNSVKALNFLLQ